MSKVTEGLTKLKLIERLIKEYRKAHNREDADYFARQIADRADWLLDRLLDFMGVSANLSLNQKANDEATMHKMALETARAKVLGKEKD